MFGWLRLFWPFPWPRKPDDLPEPTHPILLVPGICGTQLAVCEKGKQVQSSGNRVWVRIEHADAEYKQLWGRVDPRTRHLDLLDPTQEVVVPEAAAAAKVSPLSDASKAPEHDTSSTALAGSAPPDGGLYPIDILDPSLYVPLHIVYYFHNLIWYLKKHKYEAGKTLWGFGYDFRQSNMSHVDALLARIEAASAAAGGAKVDVITHSMGGLVMRCFLAARPRDYARLVRKWIAIAAPFGGAPGFGMDALMTGVQFCQGWQQYFFVNRSTMHTMCSQAPAVFELLPDPLATCWPHGLGAPVAFVVMKKAGLAGGLPDGCEEAPWSGQDSNGEDNADSAPQDVVRLRFGMESFRKLLGASLDGYKVETYDKKEESMEMNPACWDIADATLAAWRTTALPPGCQFFNAFGTGFETAYDVTYGTPEAPVGALTEIAAGTPPRSFSIVAGDSTVPVCCACADGLNAVERRGFFATHRGLLELPRCWETVMDWIDAPVLDINATAAADSAALLPHSHAVNAAVASACAADAVQRRGRAHRATLRAEADTRTESHRGAWVAMGKALPGHGSAAAEESFTGKLGDWEVVHQSDVPSRSSDCFVNPLLDRDRASA